MRVVFLLVAVLVVALADATVTVALAHGGHVTIGAGAAARAPVAQTDHRDAAADRAMSRHGETACCFGFACCVAGCVTPGILPEAMAIQSLDVAAARIRSFNEPAAGRTVKPPLDPPRRRT